MSIADNIRKLREQKELLQKDVAAYLGVDKTIYSKIEKGNREITVKELQKLAQLFNLTADQIINYDQGIPQEIVLEDKSDMEQLNLIKQLDEEDRQAIFRIVDKMLTNKKFKDFFQKNAAAL